MATKCPRCKVNLEFCFCAVMETVQTETAVDIIMHYKELALTSNSANLAPLSLPMARVHVRGLKEPEKRLDVSSIFRAGYTPIYLFPLENSRPLTREAVLELEHPIQLILPDGSWRQARKVIDREKILKTLPCFSLRNMPPSQYKLRREHFADGMSTFEAMAHALSVIEGEEKMAPLFRNFSIMVEQNLKERGQFPWKKSTAGPRR
ncbi:MAG: hypothetical protein A2X86_02270 [Bdellovibrionales bacterium GWA2_49_15]|nr:MAG: hypothetical protein A2X86_02270 [Bdellovibrionales bacterium GWA2_49_15]